MYTEVESRFYSIFTGVVNSSACCFSHFENKYEAILWRSKLSNCGWISSSLKIRYIPLEVTIGLTSWGGFAAKTAEISGFKSEESFGMNCCQIVANGLLKAWNQGDDSTEGRMKAIVQQFSLLGIDCSVFILMLVMKIFISFWISISKTCKSILSKVFISLKLIVIFI